MHFHRIRRLLTLVRAFPWRAAARLLYRRFDSAGLSVTASSLTFTTTVSLVPLLTVVLAVLAALPAFAQMQGGLEKWLVASLMPEPISRQVLGYLGQFAANSSRLGIWSLFALLFTALTLVITIDGSFNTLWQVRRRRPWTQRLLVYWALLTLGPLVLATSLAMSSSVLSLSRGLGVGLLMRGLLQLVDIALLAGGAAVLFRYLPSAKVQWPHAVLGGLLVALGIALAKKILGLYIGLVPSHSMVYGAVATLPIFLSWLYTVWLIVLMGAVVTASLPELLAGGRLHRSGPGWQFQLALELLRQLQQASQQPAKGLHLEALADAVRTEAVQLIPVLEQLQSLDWVARLEEEPARWVLLADPAHTPLAPLLERLLVADSDSLLGLSAHSVLAQVL